MASATYHHGNLRQALLEHAVDLARAGGPDAVVLRDVQRAAGVSNSAAYRHYADRQALLTAVQIYGMTTAGRGDGRRRLAEVSNRGSARPARPGPVPGHRPGLRRLRTRRTGPVPHRVRPPAACATPTKALRPSAIRSRSCAAASTISSPPACSPPTGATASTKAAWAAVHGLSMLFLDGPLASADADRKAADHRPPARPHAERPPLTTAPNVDSVNLYCHACRCYCRQHEDRR